MTVTAVLMVVAGCATEEIADPEIIETELVELEELIEVDISNSPAGGTFSARVDFVESNPSVLEIKLDYPQLGQRVQVMVTPEDDEAEQVSFFVLSKSDLDVNGEYLMGSSFEDTVQLEPGVYSIEIVVDGDLYFGPVKHEIPGDPEPEPVKAAPAPAPAPSGPRACTAEESESARQVVVYGYLAWAGNQNGNFDDVTEFVARMNQGLATSSSAKVKALLRDAISWVDGGLDEGTLESLQQRGQVIVNTGQC